MTQILARIGGFEVGDGRKLLLIAGPCVLENEAHLYGDYPEQCLDIFTHVRSEKLRMAFDFANFVSRKMIDVYTQAFQPLAPFVSHIHVKDYRPGEKHACLPGQGAGCVQPILAELARAGYAGFYTIEPHLAKAGPSGGFSGAENFKRAAGAFLGLCRQVGMQV